ncbi:ROK family protein [Mycobacterium sp. ACS4331]|uniref:ROK family protein n=1 Tax=Mycobacterium sp. ACS4331 TaxID=1834121 RepID=UPI000800E9DE|nr:ROK family protein [Mycobacterium sp. ACS4331]OBF21206.1 sugar kinase [Mycobacterium sp. ACS4331]
MLRRSPHPRSASPGELFALIRDGVATTRSELRHATGLSRTAVAARVAALSDRGLVIEHEEGPSTGGRPPTLLRFNADAGVVAAVAIGRSRTQLAITDLAGRVRAHAEVDLDGAPGPDEVMRDLVTRLEVLLTETGHEAAEVRGVGVSLPGTVDLAAGASLDSPVMSGWDGVALAPYFSGLTSAPVVTDNDANAMALAEWRGGHRDVEDLLLLKLSTGLGAGIIAGGVLQRGAVGAAGEFGHNKVPAAQGVLCRCGDTGCLEAIAGGWQMVRTLQHQGHAVHHVRDVVQLAHRGEPEARRLLRDSGRHIGEAIAAAVNLLNPAVLVIGGDMTGAYDILVAGLRETLYGNATALATRTLQVVPASLGDRSAAQGSAVLVLDRILSVDAVDAALSD